MTASPPGVTIRLADGDDLEHIVTVGRTSMRAAYEGLMEPEMVDLLVGKFWTPEANIAAIRAGRTFVAEADGRVVALSTYGLTDGHSVLWKLYVLPGHQGQGIGHALLGAATDNIAFDHEWLYMPIQDGNTTGYRFARSAGFEEYEREEQSGMPDLVWMRRRLRRETA